MMKTILKLLNSLSSFADALARPGRTFQRWMMHGLGSADVTAAGERRLGRFWSAMLAPLVAISDLWGRYGRREQVRYDVQEEERLIERRVQLAETRTRAQRFWAWVLMPLVLPFAFLWLLLGSRRRGMIWWVTPVLLLVVALGTMFYLQSVYNNPDRVANRYRKAMTEAMKQGDSRAAELFQHRLEQLGGQAVLSRYRNALTVAENGDLKRAAELMSEMAPLDRRGFPGAHHWLAMHLLNGTIGEKSRQNVSDALVHLNHVQTAVRDQPEVIFLQGMANLELGRVDEAVRLLDPISDRLLPAAGLLMQVSIARKDMEATRQQALNVLLLLRDKESKAEMLTESEHRWNITATGMVGGKEKAEIALKRFFEEHPDSPLAKVEQGKALLREFDRQWSDQAVPAEAFADHLIKASQLLPLDVYGIVSDRLAVVWEGQAQNERCRRIVQLLLEKENHSARLLEDIGTHFALEQRYADALNWLNRSTQRDPEWHQAWNNWAVVWMALHPDDLQPALDAADKAVQLLPTHEEYRETRGEIYYRLKQWQQAIDDLEIAVNAVPNQAEVHGYLAEAYQQIGNSRRSELHRQMAK